MTNEETNQQKQQQQQNASGSNFPLQKHMFSMIGQLMPFDVNSSWSMYQERVEFYFVANGITDNEIKRAVLLTAIGDKAYGILRSLVTPLFPKDLSFDQISAKLRAHFEPKPNEIVQRFHFRSRMQKKDESIADFVADLRKLSENCNFLELDNMIRDQIVCGVYDEGLQKRLFAESNLTLTKAFEIATSFEAAGRSVQVVRVPLSEQSSTVNKVDQRGKFANRKGKSKHYSNKSDLTNRSCFRCGDIHDPNTCKFKRAQCNYCKNRGHIRKKCPKLAGKENKKSNVNSMENVDSLYEVFNVNLSSFSSNCASSSSMCSSLSCSSQSSSGSSSLLSSSYELSSDSVYELNKIFSSEELNNVFASGASKFLVDVKIEGYITSMEIDSGAAVTIISEKLWSSINRKGQLKLSPCNTILQTWSQQRLQILGECLVSVQFKSKKVHLPLIVVAGEGGSLLGRNWFKSLNIGIFGINSVNNVKIEGFDKLITEFGDVFSDELGAYKGPPISMELKNDAKPVFLRHRQVEFALRGPVEREIDKLVEQGIYEPVQFSNWGTPVVTARKKDGSIRLCGDYRSTVNRMIKTCLHPLPTVNEMLYTMNGAHFYAKLDLKQAYQQLVVDDETAEILTVNTHKGLFRVRRLAFGVSASSGLFQRLLEALLRGIPGVVCYLDDIYISAETLQVLLQRLRRVLEILRENGLTVRRDKCQFPLSEVQCLGFKVNANGISPSEDKTKAIHDAPEPKNKEELQSFLGLLNFYNRFLQDKATLAEPLHRLIHKDAVWCWKKEHANAFRKLKALLQSDMVLTHYNEKKQLVLACDASSYGVGVVLAHRENGIERPIAFASRTMGVSERNYSQFDKEALSIVFGVKHFHQYLANRKFTIVTDHRPLLGIFNVDKQIPVILSPRMKRWCLILSNYDYQMEYREGKKHCNADCLSRLPLSEIGDEPAPPGEILLLEGFNNPPIRPEKIKIASRKDPVISRVFRFVLHGWPQENLCGDLSAFVSKRTELSTHNGCLLWGSRVVIPSVLRADVLKLLHANHPGISAMKACARSYVWWPNLDKDIELCVQSCLNCQQNRKDPKKAPVQSAEKSTNPWSKLHMDFAGPFKGKNFLIVVDSFSKWVEVAVVSSQSSQETIKVLRRLFATFGIPDLMISDNGTPFISSEMQQFFNKNGVRHNTSAPYHPSSNGQAERMVGYTKQVLSSLEEGNVDVQVSRFLFRQHTTPHSVTGKTPAELLMNRNLRTALDKLHPDNMSKNEPVCFDENFARKFNVGDKVFIKNYSHGPKWIKATIIEVTGPVSYVAETCDGKIARRHVDQVRVCMVPENDLTAIPSRSNAEELIVPPSSSLSHQNEKSDHNSTEKQLSNENNRQSTDFDQHLSTEVPVVENSSGVPVNSENGSTSEFGFASNDEKKRYERKRKCFVEDEEEFRRSHRKRKKPEFYKAS